MFDNRRGERPAVNFEIEFAFGYREREMGAPLDQAGDPIDETAFECIYRNVRNTVNVRPGKLGEQFPNVAMGVNRYSPGKLVPAMQSFGVGHADFDPGVDPSGEISNHHRGLIAGRDTLRQCDAFPIFQTVCKHAHKHVVHRLGRLAGDAELELFINSTIDIGQINVEVVDRSRQCQRYATCLIVRTPVYYLIRDGREDEA